MNTRERHGKTDTPEYKIWGAIKDRTLNPRNAGYKNYGGRGIGICEEWRKSFKAFNKGNFRQVIEEGDVLSRFAFQQDLDCVKYKVTAKASGPNLLGHEYTSTRAAFAIWAKSEAPKTT